MSGDPRPLAAGLDGGSHVDHIVWGVPDTDDGLETLHELTGVQPSIGRMPTDELYPTRSASIGLGGGAFFEVYGPNPAYRGAPHTFHTLLTSLPAPRLLTWFARVIDLPAVTTELSRLGHTVAPMIDEWERTTAPSFRNAQFSDHMFEPAVPRLIEWHDRMGMDENLVQGARLDRIVVRSEQLDEVRSVHAHLGLVDDPTIVLEAGAPAMAAHLDTASGPVVIN
ncbi:MAG: VOC family protein [Actinomycetota bacterium]